MEIIAQITAGVKVTWSSTNAPIVNGSPTGVTGKADADSTVPDAECTTGPVGPRGSQALPGIASIRRHAVNDAQYTVCFDDAYVGITVLTHQFTMTGPDASSDPLGQPLYIADETGLCSTSQSITAAASWSATNSGWAAVKRGCGYQKLTFPTTGSNFCTVA